MLENTHIYNIFNTELTKHKKDKEYIENLYLHLKILSKHLKKQI